MITHYDGNDEKKDFMHDVIEPDDFGDTDGESKIDFDKVEF